MEKTAGLIYFPPPVLGSRTRTRWPIWNYLPRISLRVSMHVHLSDVHVNVCECLRVSAGVEKTDAQSQVFIIYQILLWHLAVIVWGWMMLRCSLIYRKDTSVKVAPQCPILNFEKQLCALFSNDSRRTYLKATFSRYNEWCLEWKLATVDSEWYRLLVSGMSLMFQCHIPLLTGIYWFLLTDVTAYYDMSMLCANLMWFLVIYWHCDLWYVPAVRPVYGKRKLPLPYTTPQLPDVNSLLSYIPNCISLLFIHFLFICLHIQSKNTIIIKDMISTQLL